MDTVDEFDYEPSNVDMEVIDQQVHEEEMEVKEEEEEEEAHGQADQE
jgi:hypothetical protein